MLLCPLARGIARRCRAFAFDRVFGVGAGQAVVYGGCVAPLVVGALVRHCVVLHMRVCECERPFTRARRRRTCRRGSMRA